MIGGTIENKKALNISFLFICQKYVHMTYLRIKHKIYMHLSH